MRIKNRHIEVTDRPTIIVGERPGRQRKRDRGQVCFHGNRTGDFVEKWIEGKRNIILTNTQYCYYPGALRPRGPEHDYGLIALQRLIDQWTPKRVICLGKYASKSLKEITLPTDCTVTSLPHPSWVLRFNKTNSLNDYWNNWDPEQSGDVTQQPLSWLE